MKIRWTRTALHNLAAEAEYIARDSPTAAGKTLARIKNAVNLLAGQPSLGRAGRVPDTRELIIPETPYIIPYRIHDGQIEILRVFHTARKWPLDL
ncbi:MAG TPA: type II toxin-antitoxin system RelE/ParE family toxin [Desulfurivibrionaceae bacterium]|jgi:toxin ParE1/3/4